MQIFLINIGNFCCSCGNMSQYDANISAHLSIMSHSRLDCMYIYSRYINCLYVGEIAVAIAHLVMY